MHLMDERTITWCRPVPDMINEVRANLEHLVKRVSDALHK